MNGYICFYNSKRTDIYAPTIWEAKQQAIRFFKVPKSKVHMVTVRLAELAGKEVIHTPDF